MLCCSDEVIGCSAPQRVYSPQTQQDCHELGSWTKRLSLHESVLLPQIGERQEWKDKTGQKFIQNHRMVWAGRDLKDLVLTSLPWAGTSFTRLGTELHPAWPWTTGLDKRFWLFFFLNMSTLHNIMKSIPCYYNISLHDRGTCGQFQQRGRFRRTWKSYVYHTVAVQSYGCQIHSDAKNNQYSSSCFNRPAMDPVSMSSTHLSSDARTALVWSDKKTNAKVQA